MNGFERSTANAAGRAPDRSRSRSWRRISISGLLLAISASFATNTRAGCSVESVEMPVKMVGSRAVATVGINETPVPLTVDSGANFSFLTPAAADQLELRTRRMPYLQLQGIAGKIDARATTVDKLTFLKGHFDQIDFIVGGNEPGAGTMGLLGRNILSVADTEYDLAHGVIRFLFPGPECRDANMAYWAGSSPVTTIDLITDHGTETPAIRAKANLNGMEVVALLDTGATTIVSRRAAARAGIAETDLKSKSFVYGAGRGRAESWIASFDRFELGGEAVREVRLRIGDFDLWESDMLLGIDFFLSHRIYVSKSQSRMFFTYNGGRVFTLDRTDEVPVEAAKSGPALATADEFARRGGASAARGDLQGALSDLDKACELAPATAAYVAQRGAILVSLRRPDQALAAFDRALALDPDESDARLRRAGLRAALRDSTGAEGDLDFLDRKLAPQSNMRLAMARVFLQTKQPQRAVAQLDQWLAAHPREETRDGALNSRCWARALSGQELDRAMDDCDEALGRDAKNAVYLDSRGWVYLRQGRFEEAVSDFDRSLDGNKKSASSLFGRGVAEMRLGQSEKGRADLRAAKALDADIETRVPDTGIAIDAMAEP